MNNFKSWIVSVLIIFLLMMISFKYLLVVDVGVNLTTVRDSLNLFTD
jgi:hypothetical protein